jgi:hypothetical protein
VRRVYDEDQAPQIEGQSDWLVLAPDAAVTQPAPPAATTGAAEVAPETVAYHDFPLELSLNQAEYVEGDLLVVSVRAARDCYVRLYVINADQQVAQLFPNKWQQDHFIPAGQTVQIPGPGAQFILEMEPPFGTEAIKAVASTVPFEDLQGIDWERSPFLIIGDVPLRDLNTRGVGVRPAPAGPELSQAVVLYRVRPRQ